MDTFPKSTLKMQYIYIKGNETKMKETVKVNTLYDSKLPNTSVVTK